MKISLLIPVFNAEDTIGRCMECIASQERPPDETLLIDNGSTDASVIKIQDFMRSHSNMNILLLYESKRGPGAARNKGLECATGDVIVFTDSDCFPRKDWIKNIVTLYENNKVDGVGGLTYIYNPRTLSDKLQGIDLFMPKEFHAKIAYNKDESLFGNVIVTFNGSYKREVFSKIGGFDEALSVTGEDIDLSIRALENGFRILIWNPQVVVWHMPRILFRLYTKRIFQYRLILPVLLRKHFKKTAFLELPMLGVRKFPFFTSLVITKEFEIIVFFILLILIFHKLFPAVFLLAITILFIRLVRSILIRSKAVGINISLLEALILAAMDIIKKFSSEYGRVYGSIKSRMIYL